MKFYEIRFGSDNPIVAQVDAAGNFRQLTPNGDGGTCFPPFTVLKAVEQPAWWEAPEGEEYHTAYVWSKIAQAAEAAGDTARAAEARQAADRESAD